MSFLAKLKKKCYSFFEKDGWNVSKNKTITPFKFKFDILKQGRENKILYFITDSKKIKEFIQVGKMITACSLKHGLTLCISSSLKLQMEMMVELGEAGVELITFKDGALKVLISEKIRVEIEKERVKQIKKKLSDINLISSADPRIGFKIFKINEEILKNIKSSLKNETNYLEQILNLNLILDGINITQIKQKWDPGKTEIEKGRIFLLEWALLQSGISINIDTFASFRKIRKLRADGPVHLKEAKDIKELESIKKELTGDRNPDKFVLWESILQRFSLCLDYIKEGIKIK